MVELTFPVDPVCDTLTGPHQAWWGRMQSPDELAKVRARVQTKTAAALGVPIEEVTVTEHPRPMGVLVVASWFPA